MAKRLSFLQYLREAFPTTEHSPTMQIMSLADFAGEPEDTSIEEAGEFTIGGDTRTPGESEVQSFLNRVFTDDRTKMDKAAMPYVHNKLLQQVDGKSFLLMVGSDVALDTQTGATIDVDDLKRKIMERPREILSTNLKMVKSSTATTKYTNFGFSAFRAMVVNESSPNKDFVIVNTCPGAGECQLWCFARKGGYVQWIETYLKQTRILNFLMNRPKEFFQQAQREIAQMAARTIKRKVQLAVRWHDSGDFFSDPYIEYFLDMVRALPNVEFYAYTKIAKVINHPNIPANLILNFSRGARPSERSQVNFATTKYSEVVPKEIWEDLIARRETGRMLKDRKTGKLRPEKKVDWSTDTSAEELKDRIAETYKVPRESLLTYPEMLDTPIGNLRQYNVIVRPGGDGDASANRRDVHVTFLLIH